MSTALSSSCRVCKCLFVVDRAHLNFLGGISPIFGDKKEEISAPTLCPACRLQRRLAFRNPINVAWRSCAATGKKTLSAFASEKLSKVYDNDYWWSDHWSALDFGRSFDFSRGFFEQFAALRLVVPYAARLLTRAENSDYCSNAVLVKNCYFVFNTNDTEDSLYCDYVWGSKNCFECTRTVKSNFCFDCLECSECYQLQSSEFCRSCSDSWFLSQCISCSDCFGCVNLAKKSFCIFNKQHTEAEFRNFIASLNLASYAERKKWEGKWRDLCQQSPRPHFYANRSEDCNGNYLESSVRVQDSFFIIDAEDIRFGFMLNSNVKNCYDYSHFGSRVQNIYECQSVGHDCFQVLFSLDCWEGNSDLYYCASCFGCQNCFGCVGLRRKQYCVFNREYSKQEYNELVPRIIESMRQRGEWGEFFPIQSTPFPYNMSFAQRYFPITEQEAATKGLEWFQRHEVDPVSTSANVVIPDTLPESDKALVVTSSGDGRPFRITTEELKRYHSFVAPLPRLSYTERMESRWKRLGGIKMKNRTSSLSATPLSTNLGIEAAPIIWSKEEWEKEIWG